MEQNELVKQATVTVTDVAKKGAQYVENAPLIKDFNEEQKKFIRFETHLLKFWFIVNDSSENNTKVEHKTPWSGYKNEEELKDQILQLSKVLFTQIHKFMVFRISVIFFELHQLEHCSNSTTNSHSQWH